MTGLLLSVLLASSPPSRPPESRPPAKWVGIAGASFWRGGVVEGGLARVCGGPAGHHFFAAWAWLTSGFDPVEGIGVASLGGAIGGGSSAIDLGLALPLHLTRTQFDPRVRPEIGLMLFDRGMLVYGYNLPLRRAQHRIDGVLAHSVTLRFTFGHR